MTDSTTHNEELLAEFLDEAMDSLQDLPARLGEYHQDSASGDAIHFAFRSIHTIKGNAGFFGFVGLKKFAHSLEDSLDLVRQHNLPMDDELLRLFIDGFDAIGEFLQSISSGNHVSELSTEQESLLNRIAELCNQDGVDAEQRLLNQIAELADELQAAGATQGEPWADRLRKLVGDAAVQPDEELPADGDVEIVSAVNLAEAKFHVAEKEVTETIQAVLQAFVAAENEDFTESDGEASLQAMEQLSKLLNEAGLSESADAITSARKELETLLGSGMEIDAFLLSIVWDELSLTIGRMKQAASSEESESKSSLSGSQTSPSSSPDAAVKSRFLRVKEERVDEFLDDVSSLFITCERLKDLQSRMTSQLQSDQLVDELRQINSALNGQTTELQRSVVELRRVPVRGLFSKFPRVARTLANNLGKQLEVHLSGEELEIDKSLVEDLDGPITHMVRNVCDHGIERPDEREARGASPTGNLWMECELTKTHVVITVRDDGRGIDSDRLRKKAVEKGVMTPEAVEKLSEQEAVELIFHPGFSTAEKISEVSGRGVGLDVVRTRMRELNGDVQVSSKLGTGTTFRLRIPIRKAVIVVDGLLIEEQGEKFVLPFEHISEIAHLEPGDISTVHGSPVATIRGEPYGAARLHKLLGVPRRQPDGQHAVGVLVRSKSGSLCLLVDAVLGQRKVVIGTISDAVDSSDKIGGVTQLGAGKLALVLNGAELIESASSSASA